MRKHKVRPYRDNRRPHLKYVVNVKEEGKRSRSFFETKREAETFAEQKNIELLNGGIEAAQFPSALRVMARDAATTLGPFGKNIRDAVGFYLPHLQAMNRTCTFRALTDELLIAIPSAPGDVRARVVEVARKAGVPVKTLPGLHELITGEIDLARKERCSNHSAGSRRMAAGLGSFSDNAQQLSSRPDRRFQLCSSGRVLRRQSSPGKREGQRG